MPGFIAAVYVAPADKVGVGILTSEAPEVRNQFAVRIVHDSRAPRRGILGEPARIAQESM